MSKRNESRKIFEDLRTGDPVNDPNLLIRQYFEANISFYEDMSKLRRVYDAVKTLGMRDDTIEKIFGARNEMPLYQNIEDNQFSPLLISQRAALQFAQLAEDKGIPNVLTDEILEVIEQMSLDTQEEVMNERNEKKIKEHSKNVIIDISDNGKGIKSSQLKTVFEPGYTTKLRGWGLGLSLVKRIVEDYHKGQVYILHSELGKGSTFRISLLKS